MGIKRSLCQLVKNQGQDLDRHAPSTLRSVSGTIQEILILLTLLDEFPSLSVMADLWLSVVLGSSLLFWNRYRRNSAMDFLRERPESAPDYCGTTIKNMVNLPHRLTWLGLLWSFNSCCHCPKEYLLLNSCSSRSEAWKFRFGSFL